MQYKALRPEIDIKDMKRHSSEFHHIIEGSDYQGKFQIRVHKDLDQIQIENQMDDDFPGDDIAIDIFSNDLIEIRDFLNEIITEAGLE